MKLPWRRRHRVSRGQALIEFALMLPLLMLLLLLAIDFGRVFFGWVALNNAARIAANEAGFNPQAWEGSGDAGLQAIYQGQVISDMQAINCTPPGGGSWNAADVPDPTFIDEPGTFSTDPYEFGDHTKVVLTCHFSFLTPLLGNIVGNPMTITASAEFPVKGGEIDGIPVGAVPSVAPTCTGATVPSLVGQPLSAARDAWTAAGFTGSFTPASGDDTDTVTSQTTDPAANPGDCVAKTTTVTVTHEHYCTAPQMVGAKSSAASGLFSGAGFTGTVTITRPPNNDYSIGSQSLVGGQTYVCNSNMTVYH